MSIKEALHKIMPKKSSKKNKKKEEVIEGFYKRYDIEWLRTVRQEHPDGYLVDEYDALVSGKESNEENNE